MKAQEKRNGNVLVLVGSHSAAWASNYASNPMAPHVDIYNDVVPPVYETMAYEEQPAYALSSSSYAAVNLYAHVGSGYEQPISIARGPYESAWSNENHGGKGAPRVVGTPPPSSLLGDGSKGGVKYGLEGASTGSTDESSF